MNVIAPPASPALASGACAGASVSGVARQFAPRNDIFV
jgi:hypothetical protein